MQRHRSHVVEEKAEQLFREFLPPERWIINTVHRDYGKDFTVELVDNEMASGTNFWVQLKGQSKVRRLKNGNVSFKMESKHVDYFKKLGEPIFLVVVDTTKRTGYWLFLQEHISKLIPRHESTVQRSFSLEISADSVLANEAGFRSAVQRALGYMARRSLKQGILAAQDLFKEIDPRFDVAVTATSQGETIQVTPNEHVSISLKFGDDFVRSGRYKEAFGRGLPVQLGPGDVTVEGSPLVEKMFGEVAERNGQFHPSHFSHGYVRLTHFGSEDRQIGRSHDIDCEYSGGTEEVRYVARTSSTAAGK